MGFSSVGLLSSGVEPEGKRVAGALGSADGGTEGLMMPMFASTAAASGSTVSVARSLPRPAQMNVAASMRRSRSDGNARETLSRLRIKPSCAARAA